MSLLPNSFPWSNRISLQSSNGLDTVLQSALKTVGAWWLVKGIANKYLESNQYLSRCTCCAFSGQDEACQFYDQPTHWTVNLLKLHASLLRGLSQLVGRTQTTVFTDFGYLDSDPGEETLPADQPRGFQILAGGQLPDGKWSQKTAAACLEAQSARLQVPHGGKAYRIRASRPSLSAYQACCNTVMASGGNKSSCSPIGTVPDCFHLITRDRSDQSTVRLSYPRRKETDRGS